MYLQHFFKKMCVNSSILTPDDLEHYWIAYSQPGGTRAGLEMYRAFERVPKKRLVEVKKNCEGQNIGLFGMGIFRLTRGREMMEEVTAEKVDMCTIDDAGHYIAEENPPGFAERVLRLVRSI